MRGPAGDLEPVTPAGKRDRDGFSFSARDVMLVICVQKELQGRDCLLAKFRCFMGAEFNGPNSRHAWKGGWSAPSEGRIAFRANKIKQA